MTSNFNSAPDDLPVPKDDGSCSHLRGQKLPSITVPCTDSSNSSINLSHLPPKTVLFIYPATGTPGQELPEGWNEIPGARGCTPESLSFKTAHDQILAAGFAVYGMSAQSTQDHSEAKERLELPYELLSDQTFTVAEALNLPTFNTKDGKRYLTRCTLIIEDDIIAKVIYPVFPTSEAAQMVLKEIS